jgi:capsular polysaccharide biosynthesis protein
LADQIKQLQNNLSNVEGSTVSFTTLRQKVTELENNYQLYTQKRDEAQMADAMDADKLLNVAVAQAPTFSITPFRPKPVLNLLLGSFTAMFLASFMVFFAEMGRATIATPRELDRLSRYPLLATVPFSLHGNGKVLERRSKSERALSIARPPATPAEMKKMIAVLEKLRKETQAS